LISSINILQNSLTGSGNKDAKPENSYPRSKLRGISEFSLREGFCYILESAQQAVGYSVKLNNPNTTLQASAWSIHYKFDYLENNYTIGDIIG